MDLDLGVFCQLFLIIRINIENNSEYFYFVYKYYQLKCTISNVSVQLTDYAEFLLNGFTALRCKKQFNIVAA